MNRNKKGKYSSTIDFFCKVISHPYKKVNLKNLSKIRYHVNTWGFSSNKWFATNIMKRMRSLEFLDCRKTLNTQDRIDVPQSIDCMLMAVHTKLTIVDMSNNFLGEDGARAF